MLFAMKRVAVLACVAAALAGCGTKAATGPLAGCQGLQTARQSTGFLVLFGAASRLDRAWVCAHFGKPLAITRSGDGRVRWRYGTGALEFLGDRIVGTSTPGNEYSIGYPRTG
jgi:hypothetical protein